MTDSRKSVPSASHSRPKASKTKENKPANFHNMIGGRKPRSDRFLYSGMLYPSRIIAVEEMKALKPTDKLSN